MPRHKYTMAHSKCDQCGKEVDECMDPDGMEGFELPVGWSEYSIRICKHDSRASASSEQRTILVCSKECGQKALKAIAQ